MDVDWEVEVGGDAPVIEADWDGFIDLRLEPERIGEIAEASAFPSLALLLLTLNGGRSTVWTSKCDVWEPEPGALACYVDLLPREGAVFQLLPQAEEFCRQRTSALDPWTSLTAASGVNDEIAIERGGGNGHNSAPGASLTLVVREAIASGIEGYGVTAYLSTKQPSEYEARQALAWAIAVAANTLSGAIFPEDRVQS